MYVLYSITSFICVPLGIYKSSDMAGNMSCRESDIAVKL